MSRTVRAEKPFVYGAVRFTFMGEPAVVSLTDRGWKSPTEGLASTFDVLFDPSEFGPADGDPMARAIIEAAGAFRGTYELADLPGPPPGTIY